jgi:glycosyltransferase involved in cell wall biosynthesis
MFVACRGRQIMFLSDFQGTASSGCDVVEWDMPSGLTPQDVIRHYEVWRGAVVEKTAVKPKDRLRIALVGVYRIQCGISTYAEQLFPRLAELSGECRIFAERAEGAVEEGNVDRCWTRGEPLAELSDRIADFDPDIVYVEHEFGIFPNARHWLSFVARMQDYSLFVKQHSIFYHKDKLVCEAAVPNIIVHTKIGKKVLLEKGVPSRVTVIPHGCFPCTDTGRYWNMYHSPHTLVQFGFGFEYKGWDAALKAVALLKPEFPDVFYTGLFSESGFNRIMHQNYYNQLSELIQDLDIGQNVALIRGYQSDASLDAYLRTNQLAVFPYVMNGEHTVYGATGAARLAMAAGTPTITSGVPQFDDCEGVCPRPTTPEALALEIKALFESKEARAAQVERQNRWLSDNSWDNAAQKHMDLFSGVKQEQDA